ncbi:MAG: HAD family hydrolase, partial [Planctomycetota bacterium]
FLIRHPARVISSYLAKRENPTLEDLGFTQQTALFDEIATLRDAPPLVIDATDIRADPDAALRLLCESLGIPFEPAMLHWPAGPKPFDGAWAPHWYNAVHRSTGFAGPDAELPELPAAAQPLLKAALPHYERMAALRLV